MSADVLFLCPHNAAKGVIAAAYFNRLAQQAGSALTADSAGTQPEEIVSPVVVAMLNKDGIDVSHYRPRHVTPAELESVPHLVSMGCTPAELGEAWRRVKNWTDIPAVSQNPEGARTAILAGVERLLAELREKL
jgi:protein-tyrosine-phosphatase